MTNPNIFAKLLWDNLEQFAALYRKPFSFFFVFVLFCFVFLPLICSIVLPILTYFLHVIRIIYISEKSLLLSIPSQFRIASAKVTHSRQRIQRQMKSFQF